MRPARAALFHNRCQRVIVALALLAGDAGSVSVLCQLARALVSAAEHVGKQIEGVAGWRASGGSGGMAGGCDELIDALLQAASGSASSKSIRERGSALVVRIVCDLLLCRGAALLFGARCCDGVELRLLRGGSRRAHAVGMPLEVTAGQTDDGRHDDGEPGTGIEPGHLCSFACSCFSSSGE
ncbi:hypothetical protein I35_1533 [Burkholderia cenocepacia H111]|nr:hypothetical protein I35_1533 [Burkholderia cenocepacia H111]